MALEPPSAQPRTEEQIPAGEKPEDNKLGVEAESGNPEDPLSKTKVMTRAERKRLCKQPFTRIAYKGNVYSLDDFVFIRESMNTNMIAQLKGIISEGGDAKHPAWPMIEVKWYCWLLKWSRYYTKNDVEVIPEEEKDNIGDNELFATTCTSKVYADLLNGKCRVWPLTEYEKKAQVTPLDYYTRATYDLTQV